MMTIWLTRYSLWYFELKLQYSCIRYLVVLYRAKGKAFIFVLLYKQGDFSSDKSQEVDHARLWEL